MSDRCHDDAARTALRTPSAPVRLDIQYPDRLSRRLLLIKWLLAIPLYAILIFYGIAAGAVGFVAFWAILFTGRFPDRMFDLVEGFLSSAYQTMAYFPLLLTDHRGPGDYHPLEFRVAHPERLSRSVLVFVKLPSYLLGVASGLAAAAFGLLVVVAIPVWFIILVLGRYPKPLFRFNADLLQWASRVGSWQGVMRDDLLFLGTTRPVQISVALGAAAFLFLGLSP